MGIAGGDIGVNGGYDPYGDGLGGANVAQGGDVYDF